MSLQPELHDTTMEAQPLTLSRGTESTPYNESSPIQNLPPELLEEIFDLCASSDLLPDFYHRESWLPSLRVAFAFSQVCRSWRSISLNSSRLWRRIDISFPCRAKTFLIRSGTRPLQVVTESLSRGVKLRGEDLKLHAGRITSFDIYFLDGGGLIDLFKDLQSDLASLTTLSLKDDDTIRAWTTFIHLPPLVHVKKLELHNVSIPWHTCCGGSLTSLILWGQDLLTMSQLYDILHCSPKLEHIELKHMCTEPLSRVDGQPPSPASLPHLHTLTLQTRGHVIYDILSGISSPPDTTIEITHTGSDIGPDSNDKISCLTPLTRSPTYVLHSELTTLRVGDNMICMLTEGAQPWSDELADTRFIFCPPILHPRSFFHTAHTMFFPLPHFRTLELGRYYISPIPSENIVEFLTYATNLETLRIARTDLRQLSEALSQPQPPPPAAVGDGDLGMGTRSRLLCPNLRRILLGCEDRWPFSETSLRHIIDIARVRHEASIPLAVVEFNVQVKPKTMMLMEELRRYVACVVKL